MCRGPEALGAVIWWTSVALFACTAPNPEFGDDTATSSATSSAEAEGTTTPSSSTSTTTEPGETSLDGGSEVGSAGETHVDESGGSETSSVGGCWENTSGFRLDMLTKKDGAAIGPCDVATVMAQGPLVAQGPGYIQVENCGGCDSCGGEVYTFEAIVMPDTGEFQPPLPGCVHATATFAVQPGANDLCATIGLVVRSGDGMGGANVPLWMVSSDSVLAPLGAPSWTDFDIVPDGETCECPGECCAKEPGVYALSFPQVQIPPIPMGMSSDAFLVNDISYVATNLSTFVTDVCEAPPSIDWTIRTAP